MTARERSPEARDSVFPWTKFSQDSGQALVELAISLSLLITLVFGVIDFTRAIYDIEIMNSLTREGANLVSRGTTLANAASAVVIGSGSLNLTTSGRVILTSVTNQNGAITVSGQISEGGISAISKIGATGKPASLPADVIPQPNQTAYVAEVYYSFQPITPIGDLLNRVLFPSQLYDVAYY